MVWQICFLSFNMYFYNKDNPKLAFPSGFAKNQMTSIIPYKVSIKIFRKFTILNYLPVLLKEKFQHFNISCFAKILRKRKNEYIHAFKSN